MRLVAAGGYRGADRSAPGTDGHADPGTTGYAEADANPGTNGYIGAAHSSAANAATHADSPAADAASATG